jgi:hypothetical protein
VGALAVSAATITLFSGTAHAATIKAGNPYGYAQFVTDGDLLSTCDTRTDGVKVRASIQKWYDATSSWQAIGVNDAPASACDSKVIDVEPDSSLVRIHIWAEIDGNVISDSHSYSPSFHAND